MATITRQAPVLPAPSGRAGFGGTLRSEFTKIGSVRSTYWSLLMLFAVSVGIGAAISAVVATDWSQPLTPGAPPNVYDPTQISMVGLLVLGQLVIVVPGALVLTAEYSTGMIRTSLIAMPRRIVLYAAKAVAFAAVALVVSLATAFTAFFLGQSLLASTHQSATLAGPGVLRAVIGSALYITLCGLFAFAAAAIIRNTAATITAMIGLLFVLPVLVNLLPPLGQRPGAVAADLGGPGHLGHGMECRAAELAPVLPMGPIRRVRRLHRGPARRGRHLVPQAGRLTDHAGS